MKKIIRKISHYRTILILFGIIGIAVMFRYYRFYDWISFGMDQEYQALIARNIVTGLHFPLIGVNVSDTGMYLGPLFSYFAALLYFITGGNPAGWAFFSSLLGVVTTLVIYYVSKRLFSVRTGLFSSLLFGASFLTSFYDRQFWNPVFIPILSLLIGFSLWNLLLGKKNSVVSLAILFSIALQCHYSIIIFVPLILGIVLVRWKKISIKEKTLSALIFFIFLCPILVFEFRHNGINTRAFISLIRSTSSYSIVQKSPVSAHLLEFLSTAGRFFWVPLSPDLSVESGQCRELAFLKKNAFPEIIIITFIGIGLFFVWYIRNSKKRKSDSVNYRSAAAIAVISGILCSTFIFVLLYPNTIFEYYYLYLFPWIAVILGKSLDYMMTWEHGSVIVFPIVFIFTALNFLTLFTASMSYSYSDKIRTIDFVRSNLENSNNYRLEAVGGCPKYGGYHYLFEHFINKPSISYMDSYYSWLYQNPINNEKVDRIVLLSFIDPRLPLSQNQQFIDERLEFLTSNKSIIEKQFGKITINILK